MKDYAILRALSGELGKSWRSYLEQEHAASCHLEWINDVCAHWVCSIMKSVAVNQVVLITKFRASWNVVQYALLSVKVKIPSSWRATKECNKQNCVHARSRKNTIDFFVLTFVVDAKNNHKINKANKKINNVQKCKEQTVFADESIWLHAVKLVVH